MTDGTLNRKNCGCKYCGSSRQKQAEISHSLGLKASSVSHTSTTVPSKKPRIRLVLQPRKLSPSGNMINHDRNSDLRSSRRFRVGELIWCALFPPIQGEHEEDRIEFWPGLVTEPRLKSDVLSHPPGEAWRVTQCTVYKVKLLGITHSCILPETAALPYQAYGPSLALIERLRRSGNPALLEDRQQLSDFHPITLGGQVECGPQAQFVDAATPFALAIQIAAHLVRMWTPTDEWKFHGGAPAVAAATDAVSTVEMQDIHETRHLGLWWGAERIWTHELVRLQPARAQFMPQGSPFIKLASPDADARGLLLRINSVIMIPEGSLKDGQRQCRVSGALYELAGEAYKDEEPPGAMLAGNSILAKLPDVGPPVTPDQIVLNSKMQVDDAGSISKNGNDLEVASPAILPLRLPPDGPVNFPNLPSPYLPKPPDGFKFRPILKNGAEIVLDVSLISGRYYPELLRHPLLQNILADVNPNDLRVSQLTTLCGLLPGSVNSMECGDWVPTRLRMLHHADATAHEDLYKHWHLPKAEPEAKTEMVSNEAMDIQVMHNDVVNNV